MSKQGAQGYYRAGKIFSGCYHNEDSSVIGVCFAAFEPEHGILILLGESDIQSCEVDIYGREVGFLDGGVGEFFQFHKSRPGYFESYIKVEVFNRVWERHSKDEENIFCNWKIKRFREGKK